MFVNSKLGRRLLKRERSDCLFLCPLGLLLLKITSPLKLEAFTSESTISFMEYCCLPAIIILSGILSFLRIWIRAMARSSEKTNSLKDLPSPQTSRSVLFFLAKKNNTDLEVWGDGKSLREFVFSDDLAMALIQILRKESIPDKIIIAGRQQYSIKEIVDSLVKASNFKGDVIFNNNKPNGQRNRQSDLSLFNNLLPNFEFTNIEEAIKISYNWFESNYPNVRL